MFQPDTKYTVATRRTFRSCRKCFFRLIASISREEQITLYIFTCSKCGDTYPIPYNAMWGTETVLEFVRDMDEVAEEDLCG